MSIIRSLFTVHSAMVYVVQVCRQLSSRTRMVLESRTRMFLLESCPVLHTYLPMKMEQSVPKCQHIKLRRRGITQKKAYNI
jgi:hypothetical protein